MTCRLIHAHAGFSGFVCVLSEIYEQSPLYNKYPSVIYNTNRIDSVGINDSAYSVDVNKIKSNVSEKYWLEIASSKTRRQSITGIVSSLSLSVIVYEAELTKMEMPSFNESCSSIVQVGILVLFESTKYNFFWWRNNEDGLYDFKRSE